MSPEVRKREYRGPELVRYGNVQELTKNATTTNQRGDGGRTGLDKT